MKDNNDKKYIINNEDLMSEWDWNENDKIGLNPKQLTYGSGKMANWICNKKHRWKSKIVDRSHGHGCPYCSGRLPIIGETDLLTVNPTLASEWHPTKNGDLTPQNVTKWSSKIIWWQCRKGHEWQSNVANRSQGNGCPDCWKETFTSFAEQAILFYCKKVDDAINRCKDFGKEIDIYLPKYNVGIEYNGLYWHKDKDLYDNDKIKYFSDKGIRIITVKEGYKNFIDGDVIEHDYRDSTFRSLDFAIKTIFNLIGIDSENPCVKDDMYKIFELYIEIEKENSIAVKDKESVIEWNYEKNGNILPTMVSYGSGKMVWWKCRWCGHEWQSTVNHYWNKRRCPECAKIIVGKKLGKQVKCIETNVIYYNCSEAARQTGMSRRSIGRCCDGLQKTTGGFHWEWV